MCLYPRIMRNPKYGPTKKNGGLIPAVSDVRVLYVSVGCDTCMECRRQKSRGWMIRLLEDIKVNRNAKFITFTFSTEALKNIVTKIRDISPDPFDIEEGYELDNRIATYAVRKFLERWRKKYGKSLRHWLVTELGHKNTEHVHLHGIVWTDEDLKIVNEKWSYGYTWTGNLINGVLENYVNERTISYITKYVSKMDLIHQKYKPIILCSKGIGANYLNGKYTDWSNNVYNGDNTREFYRTRTGHKIALPMYWRNKIYNDDEREKLWIKKLNENKRYVLGNKIDISKNDNMYYSALKEAQKLNRQLGYRNGYNDINEWNRLVYERERRKLIHESRLNNNNKINDEAKSLLLKLPDKNMND